MYTLSRGLREIHVTNITLMQKDATPKVQGDRSIAQHIFDSYDAEMTEAERRVYGSGGGCEERIK